MPEHFRELNKPLDWARTETCDARRAAPMRACGILRSMVATESGSVPEPSAHELAGCRDAGNFGAPRAAEPAPDSGQVEQSVAVPPGRGTTESGYRAGLVRAVAKLTRNPFNVNQAMEDLRALIEETVRREVGVLRREMKIGFEAVELKPKIISWVLGIVVVIHVSMFGILVQTLLSEHRSCMPPPTAPSPTLLVPAGTETVPTTGPAAGDDAQASAAHSGSSGLADPAADPPTP